MIRPVVGEKAGAMSCLHRGAVTVADLWPGGSTRARIIKQLGDISEIDYRIIVPDWLTHRLLPSLRAHAQTPA